jgi:serine/threonine protein kinase
MEFANGCSLRELLNSRGLTPFSESEVILVIRQVVKGVKDLYEKTIVHRDLNINNVLIHFAELQPNSK